jgi:hypothetical protein
MIDALHIGLDAWIIQDGNYGDFRRGKTCAFALEFYAPTPLKARHPDAPLKKGMKRLSRQRYAVAGEVTYVKERYWVIDVGVELYTCTSFPTGELGSFVSGEVNVLVDHFAYFERLALEDGAPALIHDWRIDRIELETTPRIETSPRLVERDRTREGWREVAATDAWKHDGGFANYLLTCTRLTEIGRRSL